MDYYGQYISEYLYIILCILLGVIGWVCGWMKDDFRLSFDIWCVGLGISLILCIPDWPMHNTKPVEWLKKVGSTETTFSGKGKKKSKKEKAAKGDKAE